MERLRTLLYHSDYVAAYLRCLFHRRFPNLQSWGSRPGVKVEDPEWEDNVVETGNFPWSALKVRDEFTEEHVGGG